MWLSYRSFNIENHLALHFTLPVVVIIRENTLDFYIGSYTAPGTAPDTVSVVRFIA